MLSLSGLVILTSFFVAEMILDSLPQPRPQEATAALSNQQFLCEAVSSTVPHAMLKKPDVHFGILMYHQVTNTPPPKQRRFAVSPEIFEQQISYLVDRGYTFVTVDRLFDLVTSSSTPLDKTLALTFDDGYRSFYTNVFPVLKKYNIPATEYVITQDIGKQGSLTWDMLGELVNSGLVEIGAHTVNHLSLKALPVEKQRYQIGESKRILEEGLNISVTTVAYPFGLYGKGTKEVVKDLGFKGAVSIFSGDKPTSTDTFAWRRVAITNADIGEKLLRALYVAFEVVK